MRFADVKCMHTQATELLRHALMCYDPGSEFGAEWGAAGPHGWQHSSHHAHGAHHSMTGVTCANVLLLGGIGSGGFVCNVQSSCGW